jgi:hypothetical protein
MNDEYQATCHMIFISPRSSFIIKTETPPDTCVSQAACVGETFLRFGFRLRARRFTSHPTRGCTHGVGVHDDAALRC